MNNMLPSYFEYMKPVQPVACNYYEIRKPIGCILPSLTMSLENRWFNIV